MKQTNFLTPLALILLLISCTQDPSLQSPALANPETPITIGTLEVWNPEKQTNGATRAPEDGLDNLYPGDKLTVTYDVDNNIYTVGTYTYSAQATWAPGGQEMLLGDVHTEADNFMYADKGTHTYNQSTWEAYHQADLLTGILSLNRATAKLSTMEDVPINHGNTDVVVVINAGAGWNTTQGSQSFEHFIASAKIRIIANNTNGGTHEYIPWTSNRSETTTTMRAHIRPYEIVATNEPLISITPAGGISPIIGTLPDLGTGYIPGTLNQRITLTYTLDAKRNLANGKATVTPWTDGGKINFEITDYDMVIANEQDLITFRKAVNTGNDKLTAIQTANIQLTGEWEPIGLPVYPFRGTYDGNGHTISGLTITSGNNNAGLFGLASGATLTNIHLRDVDIQQGSWAGALVGDAYNTTISRCSVVGGTVTGSTYAAGLASIARVTTTITYCTARLEVKGGDTAGGLVGFVEPEATITACSANCTLNGDNFIGGLVGDNRGNIYFSHAAGTIKNFIYRGGGLVGSNEGSINSCYSTTVSEKANTGALAGDNKGTIGYSHAPIGTNMLNFVSYESLISGPSNPDATSTNSIAPGEAGNTVRKYPDPNTASIWSAGDEPAIIQP